MKKVLLLSEETIKKYTLVNDNVDGKYILPTIQIVQEVDLERLIGKALLSKLTDLVSNNEISNAETYKILLDEYITPYLCWQVMSQIQMSVGFKFNNSGVTVNQDDKKYQMEYRNMQLLVEQYQKYADSYALKMKNYLDSHSSDYPEYNQCVDYSHKNDVSGCGIYLDDIPYNRCNYKYK